MKKNIHIKMEKKRHQKMKRRRWIRGSPTFGDSLDVTRWKRQVAGALARLVNEPGWYAIKGTETTRGNSLHTNSRQPTGTGGNATLAHQFVSYQTPKYHFKMDHEVTSEKCED